MEKSLRMLLITRESLRRDSNEGNVLINLFEDLSLELAHICCKPEPPDNDLCQGRYFQMTDRMALDKLLRRKPMGARPPLQKNPPEPAKADPPSGKRFYDFFRSHNWNIFYILQDLLWAAAGTKSPALETFVRDFAPDLIFAPLTPYSYANRLQNQVIRFANVPAVTYLYDDIYSLKQFHLSPFYWLHRFAVRGSIRKNLPLYHFAYTMTEQQKREYEKLLGLPMRLLRKCAPETRPKRQPHEGIRLIYAGGIYYGRDETLAKVADAVRSLRVQGYDLQLHIYTSSPLKKRMQRKLQDSAASFVHPAVPEATLAEKYAESDVALHVESFHKKDAYTTRLSFSTKIVDCLASGCAVLAICPEINAGWQYLRDERAAMCVHEQGKIVQEISRLAADENLREQLVEAAQDCLNSNHTAVNVRQGLMSDLSALAYR